MSKFKKNDRVICLLNDAENKRDKNRIGDYITVLDSTETKWNDRWVDTGAKLVVLSSYVDKEFGYKMVRVRRPYGKIIFEVGEENIELDVIQTIKKILKK